MSFFSRDELLNTGMPARRASLLLFAIEHRTAQLAEQDARDAAVYLTYANAQTREQFAAKTAGANCQTCHRLLDPIAFGLENFDEIGRYRTTEAGRPVDPRGLLRDIDGEDRSFEGPKELGRILFESEQVRRCAVQRWSTFVLASTVVNEDANVDLAYRAFAASGRFDMRDLLVAITTTPAFRYRLPANEEIVQ